MSPDPYELLHLTRNPDGSLTRTKQFFPTIPPSLTTSPTLSKDIPVNPDKQTWARLYLPRSSLSGSDPLPCKQPVLIYVHGGGFVLASPSHPGFHEFCSIAASQLNVLVISVSYRLAPEHRLPAAYEDVLEALTWVKDMKDEWVQLYGDLSKCVLAGESAGGNIVYNVGLRLSGRVHDFEPLVIKGLGLIQPYFSGLERSGSELRMVDDSVLPLHMNDFMWHLSLLVGADRDHEFCNPMVSGGSGELDKVRALGWWVGVIGSDGDPLFDRGVELTNLMEQKGLKVRKMFTKDDKHGSFVSNSCNKRKDLLDLLKEFLCFKIIKQF